jgi:hypothetical protein
MNFYLLHKNEKKQDFDRTCQNVVILFFLKEFLTLCHKKFNIFFSIPDTMNIAITTNLSGNRSQLNTMNPFKNKYTHHTI